jgi:hypothetical protein
MLLYFNFYVNIVPLLLNAIKIILFYEKKLL